MAVMSVLNTRVDDDAEQQALQTTTERGLTIPVDGELKLVSISTTNYTSLIISESTNVSGIHSMKNILLDT